MSAKKSALSKKSSLFRLKEAVERETQKKTASLVEFVSGLLSSSLTAKRSKTGSFERVPSFYARVKSSMSSSKKNKVVAFSPPNAATESASSSATSKESTSSTDADEESGDEEEITMTLAPEQRMDSLPAGATRVATAWGADHSRGAVSEKLRASNARKHWGKVAVTSKVVGRAAVKENKRKELARRREQATRTTIDDFFGSSSTAKDQTTKSGAWRIDDMLI